MPLSTNAGYHAHLICHRLQSDESASQAGCSYALLTILANSVPSLAYSLLPNIDLCQNQVGKEIKLTIKVHILPYDSTLGLVLLVHRNPHYRSLPFRPCVIDTPPTNLPHEMLEAFTFQIKPALQDASFYNPHALPHCNRNPYSH